MERAEGAITLDIEGLGCAELGYGAPLASVLPAEAGGLPVIAALANNDVVPLDSPVILDATVRPLTLADDEGWQVYRRTLCFLLAKVLHEDFPGVDCRVRQSFGHNALFWSWDVPHAEREAKVAALRGHLAALIARDVPIRHRVVGYEQILRHFREAGQEDKANLLRHRNPPYLGMEAGTQWMLGFLLFILSDVGLAFVTMVAMIHQNGNISGVTGTIGKRPVLVLNTTVVVCIGPLLAIPRTAATRLTVISTVGSRIRLTT